MTERKAPVAAAKSTAPARRRTSKAAAAKPSPAQTEKSAQAQNDAELRGEAGPMDALSPDFWSELRRALIWIGVIAAAALIVLLIQPILFVLFAIVIAVMLDGGTRLLGRVLPIGRGWRLTVVVLGIIMFVGWTFWLTGTQVSEQAAQLPALIESQFNRFSAWLSSRGINLGLAEVKQAGQQLLGSLGRVTAALSSAAGILSSVIMMLVLAIFLAVEPAIYSKGLAWFAPRNHRDDMADLLDKLGAALRRLMAARLIGMMATGVLTGVLLTIAGVPMATLLGILTFMLAFLPNIGAIISGVLITLVGFSVDTQHGLIALGIYFAVQTVESYLITPSVARHAVNIPPALVLGAQIMFGSLFGILGLALADPMLAMIKVMLEERAKKRVEAKEG